MVEHEGASSNELLLPSMVVGSVSMGMSITEVRLLREAQGMLLLADRVHECEEGEGVHEASVEDRY